MKDTATGSKRCCSFPFLSTEKSQQEHTHTIVWAKSEEKLRAILVFSTVRRAGCRKSVDQQGKFAGWSFSVRVQAVCCVCACVLLCLRCHCLCVQCGVAVHGVCVCVCVSDVVGDNTTVDCRAKHA